MIHIPADSWSSTEWFFDSLFSLGVSCDIIGLSYYPKWHGEMSSLENILNNSATKYHKQLMVVETSYLHGLYYENPDGGFWGEDDLLEGYPATPEGQRTFLEDVIRLVINTPERLGIGVVLWEPAWIYPSVGGTTMQDRGVFSLEDLLLDVYANPLVKRPISTDTPTPTTTSDPDPDDTPKISAFPISGFLVSVGMLFLWQIKVQKKKLRPRNLVAERRN